MERAGLLVEAFPAARLHHWELPHKGYDGSYRSTPHSDHGMSWERVSSRSCVIRGPVPRFPKGESGKPPRGGVEKLRRLRRRERRRRARGDDVASDQRTAAAGLGAGRDSTRRGRTPGLPPAGRPSPPLAVRLSCSNGSPDPGQRLPDLQPFSVSKHTKGNAQGVKAPRPNLRDVPKRHFRHLDTTALPRRLGVGRGLRDRGGRSRRPPRGGAPSHGLRRRGGGPKDLEVVQQPVWRRRNCCPARTASARRTACGLRPGVPRRPARRRRSARSSSRPAGMVRV